MWAVSVLDPILDQLARVETEEQLQKRVVDMFKFIDEDDSDQVCCCLVKRPVLSNDHGWT